MAVSNLRENIGYWQERVDLAAAFRWTARLNLHEGVANHFSFATNESGLGGPQGLVSARTEVGVVFCRVRKRSVGRGVLGCSPHATPEISGLPAFNASVHRWLLCTPRTLQVLHASVCSQDA